MPTSTTHRNLVKPDPTEAGKTVTYNGNFDKLEKGYTVKGIANEAQAAFDAVRWEESTGRWRKALDTDVTPHRRGIAQIAAAALATQYGQVTGVVTNAGWSWTVGNLIYVSAVTAGALTATAPTASSVPIGIAISATEVWLLPDEHLERMRKGLTYNYTDRTLTLRSTTEAAALRVAKYRADATLVPIESYKSRGTTEDAHAAVISGDELINVRALGSDGTAFQFGMILKALATETWSGTVRGTRVILQRSKQGTLTLEDVLEISGLGNVILGVQAALATTATDGFTYIPSCAGTPTGTPTAVTGKIPLVYDSTNNILYAFSNGAWRVH